MIRQHQSEAPQDEFQRRLAEWTAALVMFDWADTDHIDVAIRHLASVEEALAVAVRLARRTGMGNRGRPRPAQLIPRP